ncbi:MAG TPA: hypothetical protein VK539_34005 [Myxococcaceae bacterium]|nr:hypothetical protein [Myxococcaceae bacterium]
MRTPRLSAALVLVAACASCAGTPRLEREGSATLTGVVVPPRAGVSPRSTSCVGVTARVAHVSEPEQGLGTGMVKELRGRCLFVISQLPSHAELVLTVSPGITWRCEDGAPPKLTPAPPVLKLRDYETVTRDFRAACE